MITDFKYQDILRTIHYEGDVVKTRNATTKSIFDLPSLHFSVTPLVTLRKTAWKLALREMEWFMSGDPKCPDQLLHWWDGQLNEDGMYLSGYADQFRRCDTGLGSHFDQVQYVMDGLRNNPNSRRLVITTWNPWEMAHITEINENPNTPSCCHGSLIQFFVRQGHVFMTHYQRSSDMLLGFPHNAIQYWALLLYFAHQSGLQPGYMKFVLGDAHIYQEESHIEAVHQILDIRIDCMTENSFELIYQPQEGTTEFKSSDFVMKGVIPEPKVLTKPKLL